MSVINVMIDLETLGMGESAIICSIGACTFMTAEPQKTFYHELDIEKQPGRVFDPSTVKFWMKQGNAPVHGTYQLSSVLSGLNVWLENLKQPVIIWANGTDFDIPMLKHAYQYYCMKPNWRYDAVRDYRTMRKLFPNIKADEFTGSKHNALDDAINQAAHLTKILRYMEDKGVQ